jgi:gamma-glutamyl hercynylcysteine S-oxide synthase
MSTIPAVSRVLMERMVCARARTDELFALLQPEALYSRPIPERHRLVFYLGHLEAFDWNLIARKTQGIPSFHPEFDQLFEFGIDPPVGQAAQDQPADWPSAADVRAYGLRTRRILDEVLEQAPEQIVQVAIEHRLMHAETLAYLLHSVPFEGKIAVPATADYSARPLTGSLIQIPGGEATLGQKAGEFGWDNEFDEHRVSVPAFAIGKYKVTNGEYLDFVKTGAAAPHFWVRRGDAWFLRGMFEEISLPLNAPAWVTYAQAEAYARWVAKSLPTEAQFHRAAYGTSGDEERQYPWGEAVPGGDAAPEMEYGNFDFHHWDPVDVNANPAGDSAFGVSQLLGNGWEWTSTPFGPFKGFQPFAFYPGYSKNFFDEEHYVMKGASPRTAACFLRRSFRNWFRPNYPYVYASFRLVGN